MDHIHRPTDQPLQRRHVEVMPGQRCQPAPQLDQFKPCIRLQGGQPLRGQGGPCRHGPDGKIIELAQPLVHLMGIAGDAMALRRRKLVRKIRNI